MVKIKDNIYGEVEISEPVILELLSDPSILRLKNISQYGVPDKYYYLKNFDRYEHSVGVMLGLRQFGASLEEQVAGLLHDVSTTAFSHVSDWVFADGEKGKEDYHNLIHEQFISKTNIPKILKSYGFFLERILDDSNFSLLEKPIPEICADRWDYALRQFKDYHNPAIVEGCIRSMKNINNEMVFWDKEDALNFANNFLDLQIEHWGSPISTYIYCIFSEALKLAIAKGIISKEDFFSDEKIILNKLEKTKNKRIQELLNLLLEKRESKKVDGKKKVMKKFRYVDPKIRQGKKIVRLSFLDKSFKKRVEEAKLENEKGLLI